MLYAQLVNQGFAWSHNDPCLYAKYYPDGTSMDITVYVDDMFVTTNAGQAASDDLDAIHKKFGTTLTKNPGYFLGMNITYVGLGKIHLSSRTYVENLEKRWAEACTGESLTSPATLGSSRTTSRPSTARSRRARSSSSAKVPRSSA